MKRVDLMHIKDALETAIAELETLCVQEDWFCSDSLPYLQSALEIVISELDHEQ